MIIVFYELDKKELNQQFWTWEEVNAFCEQTEEQGGVIRMIKEDS